MTLERKRVVIVEDHPMVRERLAELVNKENGMEVCGEAEDAETGLDVIREQRPDLAIVDITLKGSNGLELVKNVRKLPERIRVLILSMHDESIYAQRALRAGASGYVSKNATSAEVARAARQVLAGEIYLSNQFASGALQKRPAGGSYALPTRSVGDLSDRELSVLEMLGQGNGTRAIAEALGLSNATIDTYKARIKEKMNLQTAFELQDFAIRWVRERGTL